MFAHTIIRQDILLVYTLKNQDNFTLMFYRWQALQQIVHTSKL